MFLDNNIANYRDSYRLVYFDGDGSKQKDWKECFMIVFVIWLVCYLDVRIFVHFGQ
jgi:hypothetical protein